MAPPNSQSKRPKPGKNSTSDESAGEGPSSKRLCVADQAYEDAKTLFENIIRDLEAQKEALQTQLTNLTMQNGVLRAKNTAVNEKLIKRKEKVANLVARRKELKEQVEGQDEENTALVAASHQLQNDKADLEKRVAELEKANSALVESERKATVNNFDLALKNRFLREDNEKFKKRITELEHNNLVLAQTNVGEQLGDLARKTMEEVQARNEELRGRIAELEAELRSQRRVQEESIVARDDVINHVIVSLGHLKKLRAHGVKIE